MLDRIAPHDHQPASAIDIGDIRHAKARLARPPVDRTARPGTKAADDEKNHRHQNENKGKR